MGRMIRLKDEERSPVKVVRAGGKVPERKSSGKGETWSESVAGENSDGYCELAARMQVSSFVKNYRRRIQGFLWNRAEKLGVADYLKLMETEREMTKRSAQKGPREIRVLWVHEGATEQ